MTDKRNPAGGRGVMVSLNYLDKNTTTRSTSFPYVMKHCRGCGTPFRAYRAAHTLCRDCYYWDRALTGITMTARALQGVRS